MLGPAVINKRRIVPNLFAFRTSIHNNVRDIFVRFGKLDFGSKSLGQKAFLGV